MRTEIVKAEPKPKYPRLVVRKDGCGSDCVVLFERENRIVGGIVFARGVVLSGEDNLGNGPGHVGDDFRTYNFQDFDGEVRLSNDAT